MPLEPTREGLLARAGDYEPLRAFSQGGYYWDKVPQKLILESGLAEFLPPVETEEDERGKYGRFHREQGQRELLSRSRPLGRRGIPPRQLERLKKVIDDFQRSGGTERAQPQNRELIERFQLPNLDQNPELYRLIGPWWNRRLQVLWGCERGRDSSLPAAVAAGKLREDTLYNSRRFLGALLLLFLLLLLPAFWWLQSNPSQAVPNKNNLAQTSTGSSNQTQASAAALEAEARKAQADAAKARAAAEQASKEAEQSRADAARKEKAAAEAAAAADRAEQQAREAQQAADQAQARMGTPRRDTAQTTPEGTGPRTGGSATPTSASPGAQSASPESQTAAAPQPPPGGSPGKQTSAPTSQSSAPANTGQPGGSGPSQAQPSSEPKYEIVLGEPSRQTADGDMEVLLEVRSESGTQRALPVESWSYDDRTVKSENQLKTTLGGGDHLIRAVVRDASGKTTTVEAVITVDPGKMVRTGGKVSLRPKGTP